jgi:hypothetical protein
VFQGISSRKSIDEGKVSEVSNNSQSSKKIIEMKKAIKKKRTRASAMDLDQVIDDNVKNNFDKVEPIINTADPSADLTDNQDQTKDYSGSPQGEADSQKSGKDKK